MKKVVVIDDDITILEAVSLVLESEGYEVRTASTSVYLNELLKDVPDLVILDIRLAGEDGRELCRLLKGQEMTSHVPVILFSAHHRGDVTTLLQSSQADYFLPKPFDINQLTSLVKQFAGEAVYGVS
ncbi:MAG: response regulator [bacterium]|nr:response regulator [bacterium]